MRRESRTEIAEPWLLVRTYSWIMVMTRPTSFGRFSSSGSICLRPSFASWLWAWAAALRTEMLLMCGDSVGVEFERMLPVVLITPLDFEARRSRARPFCCIRSACRRNRLSVFGSFSVLWKRRWDR